MQKTLIWLYQRQPAFSGSYVNRVLHKALNYGIFKL